MKNKTLKQAKQLINNYKKEEAKTILLQYVRQDSSNEEVWLLLASLLIGRQRLDCLEWALTINPENEQTRALLLNINPLRGYADPNWKKQDYFLEDIPPLEEESIPSDDKAISDGTVVFKSDISLTMKKSFWISFGLICAFLFLRLRFHLPGSWIAYILINIVVFAVCFVFLYLCLSLHFRDITVTQTQMIIEKPKYRLRKERRIVQIKDVLVEDVLEQNLADKKLQVRNAEPVSIAHLNGNQIIRLVSLVFDRKRKSDM